MSLAIQAQESLPGTAEAPPATSPGVRLAVISTPRTGNTWLRHLLAYVYRATELAYHNPADVDWANLPSDCVLQIHWHRTPAFQSLLKQHGFRIVVMARHPLDVLLSILHYAMHDASPQRWLEGEQHGEASICGAMPCSTAFMQYATGRRAAALLGISRQWWDLPEACQVHYENLVADPMLELTRVVEAIGAPPRQALVDAVAANTLGNLRQRSGTPAVPESDHHFWQGRPGHWKRLLLADGACAIAAVHAEIFSALGYECDPNPALSVSQADANWIELNRSELTTRLWNHTSNKQRLAHLGQRCEELEAALEQRTELLIDTERQRGNLLAELDHAHQAIQALSRAPANRVASLVKRLLRV